MKRWKCSTGITALALMAASLLIWSNVALAQDENEPGTMDEPGVLILSVQAESPAAEAGLVRGDIVLSVDGAPMDDALALRSAVVEETPGDVLTLTVLHGDDERQVEITLGERNGRAYLGIVPFSTPIIMDTIERRELLPDHMPDHMLEHGTALLPELAPHMDGREGISITLVVVDVMDGSPAAEAGLQPNDEIQSINGESLRTPEALVDAVQAQVPGDTITLIVHPADATSGEEETEMREVTVTLAAHPDDADQAYLGVQFATKIQIERADHTFGEGGTWVPGDHLLRRFQFRMPQFMPHIFDGTEAAGEEAAGEEECVCGSDAPQGSYPMMRPRHFFWMQDGMSEEDVIIMPALPSLPGLPGLPGLSGSDGSHHVEEFFFAPGLVAPSAPDAPAPIHIEIVDESI